MMMKIFLLMLFLLPASIGFAQEGYEDSLHAALKKHPQQDIAGAHSGYITTKKDAVIQSLERDNRKRQQSMYVLMVVFILVIAVFAVVYLLQHARERKNQQMMNLQVDNLKAKHAEISEKFQNTLAVVEKGQLESQDQRLLKKAIEIIENNLSDTLFGVEKMADEVGVSRATLNRRLKIITGFPPGELIRSIRLRKAALLLRNKSDNVSQVSFAVGFEDQSYFSKSFKKRFGMPPSEYATKSGTSSIATEPSNGFQRKKFVRSAAIT